MERTQEGFIVPLIIIIIAGLGVGGGVYYSKKVKQQNLEKGAAVQKVDATIDSRLDGKIEANSNQKISDNGKSSVDLNAGNSLSGIVKTNMTMQELLSVYKGKTLECISNFADPSSGMTNSGTTYIHGNLIRSDNTMMYKGAVTKSSMIIKDGNEIYSWTGSQGTKMSINASFDINTALSMSAGVKNSSNQKSEYSCTPWIADASKFVPPASVKFTDYGTISIPSVSPEMMKQMIEAQAGTR